MRWMSKKLERLRRERLLSSSVSLHHSNKLKDPMLQVIMYMCVSKQASLTSTCLFVLCQITKSTASSSRRTN